MDQVSFGMTTKVHLEFHGSNRKPITVSVATGISIVQSVCDITTRRTVVGFL